MCNVFVPLNVTTLLPSHQNNHQHTHYIQSELQLSADLLRVLGERRVFMKMQWITLGHGMVLGCAYDHNA